MAEKSIRRAGKAIILAGGLAGALLLRTLPVMAAEMEEMRQESLIQETEVTAEVGEQEAEETAEACKPEEKQDTEKETVSDDIYIDAAATMPDELRSCQINMTALLPDELRIDLYADVRNVSTHTVYRLPLYYENGYTQRCFVEPGEYAVTNIGVYDDSTGKYAFVFPEDFALSDNEAVDLFTMLADEEAVQEEIDERLGNTSSVEEPEESDPWEGLSEDKELTVPSDYEVMLDGTGGGKVGIQGDAAREYEIVIRIEKGGIPAIMTVKYSMHGEAGTWSDETAVPLAGNLKLIDNSENGAKDSGLTAYFSADPREPENLFMSGDKYCAFVPDPTEELSISHKGDGAAALSVREIRPGTHAFHLLYDGGYAIRVEVLRGGSFGEAVVHLSTDGGKSYGEEMYLPEDGIIRLEDVGVELLFTGTAGESLFVAGDSYSVEAVKEDYVPLIIGVTALLLVTAGILYGLFRRY
ncbi:MAG: hypothetical protein K6G83_07830, partial [Lachnospiraceae bacterium]|nr:hypothetical protein [Lachnospiraceae bacterium]